MKSIGTVVLVAGIVSFVGGVMAEEISQPLYSVDAEIEALSLDNGQMPTLSILTDADGNISDLGLFHKNTAGVKIDRVCRKICFAPGRCLVKCEGEGTLGVEPERRFAESITFSVESHNKNGSISFAINGADFDRNISFEENIVNFNVEPSGMVTYDRLSK